MKAPVSWLKEYVSISISVCELAEKLTIAGIEVTNVKEVGQAWGNIVVGEISEVKPHPNADRLRLVTVNIGDEQPTVICGAPNLNIKDKIAFAKLGAELIDGHSGKKVALKKATIRGVESSGMICSEKELGISDEHARILVLPSESAVGASLTSVLGDAVLDFDITPNRADLLSVIGIAREVAAITDQKPNIPEPEYEKQGTEVETKITVEIEDKKLCPRYCASLLSNIKIGESPQWLKARLIACGMRPINNVVDITNYVMLEYGQPLHAFDYDKIRDKKIIVRRAADGEKFNTLDDTERTLDKDMLVIADGKGTVAIAGVMGGSNSEVGQETKHILLESANFNAASIHYTSRKLGICSEASMRFERNISPWLALQAIKKATRLMIELAGGKAVKDLVDEYPGKKERTIVELSWDKAKIILKTDAFVEPILRRLTNMGFQWAPTSSAELEEISGAGGMNNYWIFSPHWRTDINYDVDVIEEIARITGYDKIPAEMMEHLLPGQQTEPMIAFKKKVRQVLVGYGFQEIISYSMTSEEMLAKTKIDTAELKPPPLRLANPMNVDQQFLRTNIRAGLLEALESNRRYEEGNIKLFELGRVFIPKKDDLPYEPELLYAVMSSAIGQKKWPCDDKPYDFLDAKGVVEGLLCQLGIKADYQKASDEGLRPGYQADIIVDGKKVGVVGEVHPKVAQAFGIDEPVYLLGVSILPLLLKTTSYSEYKPVIPYPPVVRDIALVLDNEVNHQQVVDSIKDMQLLKEISLFDIYTGKQVPEGKKSLAYRLTFQSDEHTLTDEEVDKVQEEIIKKLAAELGASLRT